MGLSKERRRLLDRLRNPRQRGREGLFLVEGIRGAGEFLRATVPMEIRFALVSPRLLELGGGPDLNSELLGRKVPVEEMEEGELEALSDTEASQGILLVVREPETSWPLQGDPRLRLLLLDGIQDPGNLGTLLRTARAFGVDGVVALDGTADPWSPKAVRGGAGASAHVPVWRSAWPEARDWLRGQDMPILVADAVGRDVREAPSSGSWALVLGNEGAGVRQEIRDEAQEVLSIPMAEGVESLNVAMAGAILLFSLSPETEPHGKA